jgi:hypothetical protein
MHYPWKAVNMAVERGSWDRKINNAIERFKVLTDFNGEAVLDRETDLVWERRPSMEGMIWSTAKMFCAQKAVGGRGGWRLPSFNELTSLIDPTITDPLIPRLPKGHPFLNVQVDALGQPVAYWSATSVGGEPGFVLAVHFFFHTTTNVPILVKDVNTGGGTSHFSWAVRGGPPGQGTY